jgi:hypothetical protein
MDQVSTERSLKSTLLELFGLVVALAGTVVLISVVSSGGTFGTPIFDWGKWWLLDIGRSFLTEANWLLPTFLAIVLAFYAALIGQSFANTSLEDVLRTRSRLVPAGIALASFVILFTVSAVLACISSPEEWPRIPGVVIVAIAVCLLGIGVGRFESRSRHDQLETAQRQRQAVQARLDALSDALRSGSDSRSRAFSIPSPTAVMIATGVAFVLILTAPVAVGLLIEGNWTVAGARVGLLYLALNGILVTAGVFLPLVLMQSSFEGRRSARLFKTVLAAVCVSFLGTVAVVSAIVWINSASTSAQDFMIVSMFILPSAIVCTTAYVSLFASPNRSNRQLFKWTLRSALIESVRQSSVKELMRLDERIGELDATLSPDPGVDSSMKRFTRMLRMVIAESKRKDSDRAR